LYDRSRAATAHRIIISRAGAVEADKSTLVVDGRCIAFYSERDPSKIPWAAAGATRVIVVESSGVFVEGQAAAAHLNGGAAKVIISAPAKDQDTPVLVMGVNHECYDAKVRRACRFWLRRRAAAAEEEEGDAEHVGYSVARRQAKRHVRLQLLHAATRRFRRGPPAAF
jgi:hypothetical protein